MRLALSITVASIALTAFGIHLATATGEAETSPAERYLLLANHAPDQVSSLIASALPRCLPAGAQPLVAERPIAELAVKTLFKSGVLAAQGKTAKESATEFIQWITQQAEPLSASQKEDYLKLLKTGLNSEETMLCVYGLVSTAAVERIDLKAHSWNLRN